MQPVSRLLSEERCLAEQKIVAVIPDRANRNVKFEHTGTLYQQRIRIERLNCQCKIRRTNATLFDG